MHEFSDEFSSRVQCGPRRCKEILNIYVLVNNYGHHLLFRKEIPDSVSDAASNYALDEVLSKYKDSAVNAENTVKQESTVTDKLDKILTTKWNIPNTSSLTNSIRNPSLALIRDKKGNISLEVQHDQRNICDKKLRDKVDDPDNFVMNLLKWKVENNY